MEGIVGHACHDLGSLKDGAVEGAYLPPLPSPLPANGGLSSEYELTVDMHVGLWCESTSLPLMEPFRLDDVRL